MAKTLDLELFREILKDPSLHIAVGKVTQLGLATDRSLLRVQVSILPEEREIVAVMTWEDSGPESGIFGFPEVDDLVLVGFAEGNDDDAYVLRRLSSKEEKIPFKATVGHLVMQARPGKKSYLVSDTKIALAHPTTDTTTDPLQPIPLGNVLKTLLGNILTQLSSQAAALSDIANQLNTVSTDLATHVHTSAAPGSPTTPPVTAAVYTAAAVDFVAQKSAVDTVKSNLDNYKASPVNDNAFLSDLAFTEK